MISPQGLGPTRSVSTWRMVLVREVSGDMAHCEDSYGGVEVISTTIRPGSGGMPRPGERWMITKPDGGNFWVFTFLIGPEASDLKPINSSTYTIGPDDHSLTLVANHTSPLSIVIPEAGLPSYFRVGILRTQASSAQVSTQSNKIALLPSGNGARALTRYQTATLTNISSVVPNSFLLEGAS